jgi:hypothetical protein
VSGSLRSVSPPGLELKFQYDPEQLVMQKGVGGWSEVDRPRRPTALEWTGQPLHTLDLDLLYDQWPDGHVENEMFALAILALPTAQTGEPPILSVAYAGLDGYRWVIQDCTFGDELRRSDGKRCRQQVTVNLLEWRGLAIVNGPAAKFNATATVTTSRPKTYTVRAGDTLSTIAAKQLGSASKWQQIATLNGLRDPNRITVGQVLKLP